MDECGIRGPVSRWFKCYLENRTIRTSIDRNHRRRGEWESAGDKGDSSTQAHSATVEEESQNDVVACFSKGGVRSQVLLATALVRAVGKNGGMSTIRALLDQGSQASFVTERTVQSLGLHKKAVEGSITGIGGHNKLSLNSVVEVKIQSRINSSFELVVKAYVLKSITSLLPGGEISYLDWTQVSDMELADPGYNKPDKVDMLLGAEIYSQVLQNGFKRAPDGSTIAQATSLGWILSGTVASASQQTSNITVMHAQLGNDEILKKFWEIDKEPHRVRKQRLIEEEARCEETFMATSTNKEKCAEVMKESLQLGHMREQTKSEEQNEHAVYLPHHAVARNDKDTTKVRVVFDPSCKGKNGVSLNDDLIIGPRLQPDLRNMLISRRTHPFLAVRSMQQVAYDDVVKYLMTGCDTTKEGMQIYNQLNELIAKAGFTVQKGLSSSSEVLEKMIGKKYSFKGQDEAEKVINIKQDEIFKKLVLTWNRTCDTLQYSVELPALQETVKKKKLWVSGIGWDEEVSYEKNNKDGLLTDIS
ncbi:uncharacterized protein LOC113505051 [Trichoplusia ni]|uniref:Uncharacterized protein LOC113505051 n=1 Tax=Trichoplusia ni TaxID=7111 RepID=A0A7E5WRG4_TRINI|nr:uncharacterized protein LOC113505051 [Trichoplusia ni]